eukprot:TRINITY_DN4003_c0_g1_i1.p1 TRINITY_DN4003_c0_g1~~TRINITY_DN4003_c0_g1_i1.p1  ORF type:complete len:227 (-),score=69.60 TRINITY_DN4003_c0_g1_i1:37-717(-)
MEQTVAESAKKVNEFAKIEPRLIRNIADVEDRLVKFRHEVNPHDIFKTIKAKAESNTVDELISVTKALQSESKDFQTHTMQQISFFDEALKKIIPIFEELKVMTAARQSKCLVCGNRASNAQFEKRVEASSEAMMEVESLGRNRSAVKNRTQMEELRPRTMDRNKLKLKQSSSNARIIIVAKNRNEDYFTGLTCKAKYKLPLSYQIMNERHKEGAGNLSKSLIFNN